jgi:hypothetical protein
MMDLLAGCEWSPIQADILEDQHRHVAIVAGRRFGKSFVTARLTIKRMMERMNQYALEIRKKKRQPWAGHGKSRREALLCAPDVEAWCITPRERHQEQASGYVMQVFGQGDRRSLLHPDFGLYDRGKQVWLSWGGVVGRLRFVTGSSVAAMVGGALDVAWFDEAGLVDNMILDAIAPTLYDRRGSIVASGTPAVGYEHWFTRFAMSGLPQKHERWVPDIVEPNPDVGTHLATSLDAYLPDVRVEAKKEIATRGEPWARQWIFADWRMQSQYVYDEWSPAVHVQTIDTTRLRIGDVRIPRRPDLTYGVIDWSYGAAPGAAIVAAVWYRNPLVKGDTRPLIAVLADEQQKASYSEAGWWSTLRSMAQHHGVATWFADPASEHLIKLAKRGNIGAPIRPAHRSDKAGRIQMTKSLLHHSDNVAPSLYVSEKCQHTMRQFATYRWRVSRSGLVSDRTIDYDDHCLDCIAFLVGSLPQSGSIPRIAI